MAAVLVSVVVVSVAVVEVEVEVEVGRFEVAVVVWAVALGATVMTALGVSLVAVTGGVNAAAVVAAPVAEVLVAVAVVVIAAGTGTGVDCGGRRRVMTLVEVIARAVGFAARRFACLTTWWRRRGSWV